MLQVIGPAARIADPDEVALYRLGAEHLLTYSINSVRDCFVKPALTMMRNEIGKQRDRSTGVARPIRVMNVGQVLRLLETAENDPRILRWDPDRWTYRKILFQHATIASPGETCAVLAADIDAQHQRVWIAGRDHGGRKNLYRRRYVYLPDYHWQRLGELPKEGEVFLARRGQPYAMRMFRGGQYRAAFASVI